jgi:hypothetical protein
LTYQTINSLPGESHKPERTIIMLAFTNTVHTKESAVALATAAKAFDAAGGYIDAYINATKTKPE